MSSNRAFSTGKCKSTIAALLAVIATSAVSARAWATDVQLENPWKGTHTANLFVGMRDLSGDLRPTAVWQDRTTGYCTTTDLNPDNPTGTQPIGFVVVLVTADTDNHRFDTEINVAYSNMNVYCTDGYGTIALTALTWGTSGYLGIDTSTNSGVNNGNVDIWVHCGSGGSFNRCSLQGAGGNDYLVSRNASQRTDANAGKDVVESLIIGSNELMFGNGGDDCFYDLNQVVNEINCGAGTDTVRTGTTIVSGGVGFVDCNDCGGSQCNATVCSDPGATN